MYKSMNWFVELIKFTCREKNVLEVFVFAFFSIPLTHKYNYNK